MRSEKEIDNNYWGYNSRQDRFGLEGFDQMVVDGDLVRAHTELKKDTWVLEANQVLLASPAMLC